MDLSSNRSQDEDKVLQRQLYRAGQNPPAQASASTASRPSSSAAAKPKRAPGPIGSKGLPILTPSQRRKALIALGVAAWLLLLGSISYCLSLPDLEALNHERMAIWQDQSLTPEQKREKFEALREKEKNLTPAQRKQMREIGRKEMTRKMNKSTFDFFKLSPQEQVAQMKKEKEEWDKRRQEWEKRRQQFRKGGGNRGGGQNGGKGGGQNVARGGGGPGGPGGGGDTNAAAAFGSREDSRSPESRAGGLYKMRIMQQMGGFGGGRGGP